MHPKSPPSAATASRGYPWSLATILWFSEDPHLTRIAPDKTALTFPLNKKKSDLASLPKVLRFADPVARPAALSPQRVFASRSVTLKSSAMD